MEGTGSNKNIGVPTKRELFGCLGLTSREVKLLLALGWQMRGIRRFAQRFKSP